MVKGRRKSVNSLTALMDGLNVNAEPEQPKKKPPKKDPTDLLLYNLKNLNLTDKKQFKQPRTSSSKKLGTKKPKYSRMDVEKAKKVFKRRTLSARNADDKLSEALDKLGLGNKKKEKKDVPKVRNKEEKDVLKQNAVKFTADVV